MKNLLTILFFTICSSILQSQTSYIQVISNPDVSVFLDDTFKGKTSIDVGGLIIENVNSGSHILKFVKDGFNPQEERINIKPGEVLSYEVKRFIPKIKITQRGNEDENSIKLSTGDLKIQSLPISITIGIPKLNLNSKKNEDEWLGKDIPSGEYFLIFIWKNKVLQKTVQIESNKITHLLVNFPKMEVEVKKQISNKPPLKKKSSNSNSQKRWTKSVINKMFDNILLNINKNISETPIVSKSNSITKKGFKNSGVRVFSKGDTVTGIRMFSKFNDSGYGEYIYDKPFNIDFRDSEYVISKKLGIKNPKNTSQELVSFQIQDYILTVKFYVVNNKVVDNQISWIYFSKNH